MIFFTKIEIASIIGLTFHMLSRFVPLTVQIKTSMQRNERWSVGKPSVRKPSAHSPLEANQWNCMVVLIFSVSVCHKSPATLSCRLPNQEWVLWFLRLLPSCSCLSNALLRAQLRLGCSVGVDLFAYDPTQEIYFESNVGIYLPDECAHANPTQTPPTPSELVWGKTHYSPVITAGLLQ